MRRRWKPPCCRGCPAEEAVADWMKRMHGHSHTSILSGTDTVAVQSHGDPSVGVPGVYEVFWQVEVGGHDTRKGVVAPFVGGVRAPVGQRTQLLLADRIGQQGRIMPLHNQGKPFAASGKVATHAVTQQQVLHFRR